MVPSEGKSKPKDVDSEVTVCAVPHLWVVGNFVNDHACEQHFAKAFL